MKVSLHRQPAGFASRVKTILPATGIPHLPATPLRSCRTTGYQLSMRFRQYDVLYDIPAMKKSRSQHVELTIDHQLNQLLQRCAAIEQRNVDDILRSLLMPHLRRYTHDTMEEWQEVQEREEMEQMMADFARNDGFDPNDIPFETQILAIRKKLDDIEREIRISDQPRPDLQELRFSLLKDLNFAERDALEKQRQEQASKSRRWESVCRKIPLAR